MKTEVTTLTPIAVTSAQPADVRFSVRQRAAPGIMVVPRRSGHEAQTLASLKEAVVSISMCCAAAPPPFCGFTEAERKELLSLLATMNRLMELLKG